MEGGAEDPPAEDAPKSEKPKSEKSKGSKKSSSKKSEKKSEKKEEDKKEEEKKAPVADDEDPYAAPVKEPCCCCVCVCANEFTEEASCCGCFPIKCGAVTIGIITVVVTVILFCWNFFLFLNEYLHWWFALVCLFILCPLLVGAFFCVTFFTTDSRTTRRLLWISQMLALITVTLLCIWNLCYFVWIYKKDAFYAGMGDIPTNTYTKQSKKTFLFTMLGETVVMLVMFAYFLCVTVAYADLMHGEDKKEEDAPVAAADDDKKSEKSKKSDKSKKSEPKEDPPKEDPPAGDA